jgi:hypothetical protein
VVHKPFEQRTTTQSIGFSVAATTGVVRPVSVT